MIFEFIYIKSFAGLVGRSFEFQNGVNIIEGANESGKSTICAFIKFIFYGFPSKSEEKLRYISWHTGSASGSLTLREGDKRYRIEREVVCSTNAEGKHTFRERMAIYDAETNLIQFKGQSPGEVFFGVSAHVFESTAYIRQAADSKIGGNGLGEEAENILFSGNESINTQKAMDKLDSARAFLLHKNRKGGKIAELEAERDRIAEKLETAKKATGDIIYLEGTQRQLSETKQDSENRLLKVNAELDTFNHYTVKKACMRSKAEKSRLAEMEEKINSLRFSPAHEGKDISSEAFIRSLEEKQSALELATSRYADAEMTLKEANDKLSEMSEKLEIFERFGAKGGKVRDELVERTGQFGAKIRKNKKSAVFFLCTAVILAIVGAVLFFAIEDISPLVSYVLFTLVPICFIPAVVCFSSSKKLNRKLLAICAKFGCENAAEFEELVRAATEDEAYMVFITGNRDDAADKFHLASERLEQQSADILGILREHGFAINENTSISLSEALLLCRETQTELARLETAAGELRSVIDALAKDLSSYDEEYLRDALFMDYDEEAMEGFNLASKKRDRDFLTGSINTLTEKLHGIELELAALCATGFNPTELAAQKSVLDEQIETLTAKWAAYMLAIESIERASGKLREGISPKIARNASRLMQAITAGKYEKLGVDLDFSLSFTADGMTHDASYLSAGTGDLAYICLRIALIELLYRKSVPPFLFDESFVRMDDKRLIGVMKLLHKYGKQNCQSIIFSCHCREKRISDKLGPYTYLAI